MFYGWLLVPGAGVGASQQRLLVVSPSVAPSLPASPDSGVVVVWTIAAQRPSRAGGGEIDTELRKTETWVLVPSAGVGASPQRLLVVSPSVAPSLPVLPDCGVVVVWTIATQRQYRAGGGKMDTELRKTETVELAAATEFYSISLRGFPRSNS